MTHRRFLRGSLFCLVSMLLLTATLFVSSAKRRAAFDSLPSELDVRVPGGVLSRDGRAVSSKEGIKSASSLAREPDATQAKAFGALRGEAGSPLRAEYNR